MNGNDSKSDDKPEVDPFTLAGSDEDVMDACSAHLKLFGFEPPGRDVNAWHRLARMVERDPDRMTIADIHKWTVAWMDRQRLIARIHAEEAQEQL